MINMFTFLGLRFLVRLVQFITRQLSMFYMSKWVSLTQHSVAFSQISPLRPVVRFIIFSQFILCLLVIICPIRLLFKRKM